MTLKRDYLLLGLFEILELIDYIIGPESPSWLWDVNNQGVNSHVERQGAGVTPTTP